MYMNELINKNPNNDKNAPRSMLKMIICRLENKISNKCIPEFQWMMDWNIDVPQAPSKIRKVPGINSVQGSMVMDYSKQYSVF